MRDLIFRDLRHDDSIPAITALLHAAYHPLAERGLRFLASHQTEDVTRERLSTGFPLVGLLAGEVVATLTRYGPTPDSPCEWFRRPDANALGQFAVRPDLQRSGIGRALFGLAQERARQSGCRLLVLDTAEGAMHLRDWYVRLGFRVVDTVQWDVTNYRSIVMAKALSPNDPPPA